MPGLVAFNRRWSVGSDDVVIPAAFHTVANFIWIAVWLAHLPMLTSQKDTSEAANHLWIMAICHVAVLTTSFLCELTSALLSARGTIMDTGPRHYVVHVLYARLVVLLMQIVICSMGIVWLSINSPSQLAGSAVLLGMTVWHLLLFVVIAITAWIAYDPAGRRFIRLKKFQSSVTVREIEHKFRRSGTSQRNWRKRKLLMSYKNSWNRRCRMLCCCSGYNETEKSSFGEIAQLFSEFFSDLDLVPSDVVAGLLLLRQQQKQLHKSILEETRNETFEFLSGATLTGNTKFLDMDIEADFETIGTMRYYMQFALGAYGWPFYCKYHSALDALKMLHHIRCACLRCCDPPNGSLETLHDNCSCNYAAIVATLPQDGTIHIFYINFHVGIGETPFYIAIDHNKQSVIVAIRGTLSLKDMLTDLTASCEEIPVSTAHKDLLGHKGIVNTAVYMFNKLAEGKLLERAYALCKKDYQLVLVGHSLGGGVGAVLGMMLRPKHPSLRCYCFSPPGGLLTKSAADYSQEFVTSLVVGKDVVIRSGLPQLETLRADILRVLSKSNDHKWKIIGRSLSCCRLKLCTKKEDFCDSFGSSPTEEKVISESVSISNAEPFQIPALETEDQNQANKPDQIPLASHLPMFPPGQIIHVVRKWTKLSRKKRVEPGWTALWAGNEDFNEVTISPVMIQDHMPDGVINGLDSLIKTKGQNLRRPSAYVVPSRMNKNNCCLVRLNPAPLASVEHSDIPLHTASLLSVGLAKVDATDHSVGTLTSFDNLSRPSLDLLADDAEDSNSRSYTPFRPEMNSELAGHPALTPDDFESSPFLVRSCPTIVAAQGAVNSNSRATPTETRSWADASGETESLGSNSNMSSNITSGSYYVDWSKTALRLSDEYMLSRTISTIHEVSETTDGRRTDNAGGGDSSSDKDSSSIL